jgi:hypothetical protein
VFGALLTYRLNDTIPAELGKAGVPASQLIGGTPQLGTPKHISAWPKPLHTALITGFADALQTTFLGAVPFAVLGFIVILFLREHPLRRGPTTIDHNAAPKAAMNRDADLG